MKAMVLRELSIVDGKRTPLELTELPDPVPGDDEVLVKVSACAVCHTELDEIEGRTPPPRLPVVPGHQVVGRVVHAGKRATRYPIGARVGIAWIFSACGACGHCLGGHENLCTGFRATGRDADGGYAEYAVADERFCFALYASTRQEELDALGWPPEARGAFLALQFKAHEGYRTAFPHATVWWTTGGDYLLRPSVHHPLSCRIEQLTILLISKSNHAKAGAAPRLSSRVGRRVRRNRCRRRRSRGRPEDPWTAGGRTRWGGRRRLCGNRSARPRPDRYCGRRPSDILRGRARGSPR